MIEEIPWTAASAVGAALAGGWTIAWLTFHKQGKDGSSMKERYERAEVRAREAESRYEEVRGKAEESEKLARRCDDLRQEMEDLQRESAGLDGAREALDKFASEEEAKVREIAREGDQAREKRDRIRVETDELERANKALQEQIEAKGRQLEELERRAVETANTEAEIAKKVKELEGIEARERESRMRASMAVEEAEKRTKKAEEEVRSLGMKKEILQREVEKLEKRIGGAGDGKDVPGGGRGRLGNLTSPPICVTETGKRTGSPREEEGEALKEALSLIRDEQGLKFDQRMVWRLHTSLKVAEVSPLTVLAGISGTGKTQLPRAYAEAMGMVLLVVPVQPRWDSPMDLVGSYDYMHGRYQATELARLLWDFDRERREPSGDERMAMVLLDEMNLARTEYYFSDFLSRLELRRAGEPSPEAMLELDIPHGESEEAERIYPSERIVWVGTMNEDESTQTLSDKVIDRSNVIRFPRPKEIQFTARAKGRGGNGQEALQKTLTARQWRRWCEGRVMPDEARRTIAEINEKVMESVGRPFGHRMGQAMARYVERYPSGEWRNALADQVEMRVLPKLTGLDGANDEAAGALERLRRICADDLEDGDLAEAVNGATDLMHNAGTFVWTGRQIG